MAWPRAIDWAPNTIDFKPEEQTLLIVVQGTSTPSPPLSEACLAGAWPIPADNTLPKITSSTYLGFNLMESRAPLIAIPPSSEAYKWESLLIKAPMGVLLAATMKTSLPKEPGLVPKAYFIALIFVVQYIKILWSPGS